MASNVNTQMTLEGNDTTTDVKSTVNFNKGLCNRCGCEVKMVDDLCIWCFENYFCWQS